jgi:glycosyltransferase involved in cell wall biosynthesis
MTKSVEPHISIVLTCFREGKLLQRAIDSILAQTDSLFTTIIVFDAGDEPTRTLATSYVHEQGFLWVEHKQNAGLSAARNSGFAHAIDWVVPLDADDSFPPTAISDLKVAISQFPDADFFYGNYRVLGPPSTQDLVLCGELTDNGQPGGRLNGFKLSENWKLLGTSPCRKRVWEAIGGYDLAFSNTVQDVDFWRRALLNGAIGYWIDREIYQWHRSESGMNASVKEEDMVPLRLKSLPFYEKFNPPMAQHYADYLYRYFTRSRQRKALLNLLKIHPQFFDKKQALLAGLINIPLLYALVYRILHRHTLSS